MRLAWKIVLLLLLPANVALANPIPMCPTTTYNVYISQYQGGCVIGSLTFSGFQLGASTVPPKGFQNAPQLIAADMINVSPIKGGFLGLRFTAPWAVTGIQQQTDIFLFTVTAMPGVFLTAARATIAGSAAGGISAQASMRDTICPGGTFNNNSACVVNGKAVFPVEPFPAVDTISSTPSVTANFAPVTFANVNARARFTSSQANGSASMVQATVEFVATPEPASMTLVAIGLAIGAFARHRLPPRSFPSP